jgi:uncharacterized protein (DUF1330 family)
VSGYVLANVTWTDAEVRSEYLALLAPSLEAHGGEVLSRGRDIRVIEGDWGQVGDIAVLICFPTRAAALTWYHSEEYRDALALRKGSSDSRMLIFGD